MLAVHEVGTGCLGEVEAAARCRGRRAQLQRVGDAGSLPVMGQISVDGDGIRVDHPGAEDQPRVGMVLAKRTSGPVSLVPVAKSVALMPGLGVGERYCQLEQAPAGKVLAALVGG